MNDKDKTIIKEVVVGAADGVVNTLEAILPGVSIPYNMAKALFGAGMKLRQQRVLEWVEMIRDNPNVFTKEIVEQSAFQDAFVVALEKYLIERNEEKRKYFRNIFLGYASSNNPDQFPLEKYIHTLSQFSVEDLLTLRDVDHNRQDKNYQIYGNEATKITNIFNLIFLGILHQDPSSRLGPVNAPFVWISEFGREFIKFIVN